jgi:hypothetical protein
MFVLLEGEFEWRGEFAGETVVFAAKVGDVTGASLPMFQDDRLIHSVDAGQSKNR